MALSEEEIARHKAESDAEFQRLIVRGEEKDGSQIPDSPPENKHPKKEKIPFIKRLLGKDRIYISSVIEKMIEITDENKPPADNPSGELKKRRTRSKREEMLSKKGGFIGHDIIPLIVIAAQNPRISLSSLEKTFPSKTPTEIKKLKSRIEAALKPEESVTDLPVDILTLIESSKDIKGYDEWYWSRYENRKDNKKQKAWEKQRAAGQDTFLDINAYYQKPPRDILVRSAGEIARQVIYHPLLSDPETRLEIERSQITPTATDFFISSRDDILLIDRDGNRFPLELKPHPVGGKRVRIETFAALKINEAAKRGGFNRVVNIYPRGEESYHIDVAKSLIEGTFVPPGIYHVILGLNFNGEAYYPQVILDPPTLAVLEETFTEALKRLTGADL